MKFQFKLLNKYLGIIGLLFSLLLSACNDAEEKEDVSVNPTFNNKLFIHVNTLAATPGSFLSENVKEKIKSLRVIILSGEFIQINEKVTFDEDQDIATFVYDIDEDYISGPKRFYFIANEESIQTVQFQQEQGISLPAEIISMTDISNVLDNDIFSAVDIPRKDDSDIPAANAQLLENTLNSIYFQPVYEVIPNSGDIENSAQPAGTIYLPYSVCYSESDITEKTVYKDNDGNEVGFEATMYLVPVATKFEFHFISNRTNPVELSELNITQFDNLNFLMARVGDTDHSKTLPEETTPIYWVDWLAKVAEASWNNVTTGDQNNTFNNLYGWISDYSMPDGSSQNPSPFPTNQQPTTFTIPALTVVGETETPGQLDLGPYYLPESKNLVEDTNDNVTSLQDWYGLYFKMKDTKYNTEFIFDSDGNGTPVGIENIGALFRNTHVIITVTMGEGPQIIDGVYAELMTFTPRSAWGYVGDYVK